MDGSVRERSRTSIEHHTDSIARLIVNLCPQVLQEMYDLLKSTFALSG